VHPATAWFVGAEGKDPERLAQRQPAFTAGVQVSGLAGFVQHRAAAGVAPGTAVLLAGHGLKAQQAVPCAPAVPALMRRNMLPMRPRIHVVFITLSFIAFDGVAA
jgi:hypothetical protein